MIYYYTWKLYWTTFGWRASCWVDNGVGTKGSNILRKYDGWWFKREHAISAVRQKIQWHRDLNSLWLVSEGGQHLVSNLINIEPQLEGFTTPKMRRLENIIP